MVGNNNKFNVNDYVRISKYKSLFEKGYTPSWSTEIFRITRILPTELTTYRLVDLNDKEIKGSFYQHELQQAKQTDVYLVEKVIRRKGNKVLVKWLGLCSSHSSWMDAKDFV